MEESTKPTTTQSPRNKSLKANVPLYVGIVVVLILVIGLSALWANSRHNNSYTTSSIASSPVPAQVEISSNGFIPATITIVKGQAVVWTNADSAPHQPASDPYPQDSAVPGFDDDQPLNHGDSYSFTFDQTGIFTYHDNLNPYKLQGTVIVK